MSHGCITAWSERGPAPRRNRQAVQQIKVGRKVTPGGGAKITHRGEGQYGTTRKGATK